jgi:hypothetical protein
LAGLAADAAARLSLYHHFFQLAQLIYFPGLFFLDLIDLAAL